MQCSMLGRHLDKVIGVVIPLIKLRITPDSNDPVYRMAPGTFVAHVSLELGYPLLPYRIPTFVLLSLALCHEKSARFLSEPHGTAGVCWRVYPLMGINVYEALLDFLFGTVDIELAWAEVVVENH